jgi:hypothetical protein
VISRFVQPVDVPPVDVFIGQSCKCNFNGWNLTTRYGLEGRESLPFFSFSLVTLWRSGTHALLNARRVLDPKLSLGSNRPVVCQNVVRGLTIR